MAQERDCTGPSSNVCLKHVLDSQDTKQRILDAAEKLFSDQGLEKASLRAITLAAGVNVAAVNYHFGSKQALVRELFARRVMPINAERLRRLEAAETATGGRPTPRAIVEAFVRPLLEGFEQPDDVRRRLAQLVGQFFGQGVAVVEPLLREQFGDVGRRFLEALQRALPDAPEDEITWRFQFAIGVVGHVLSGHHTLDVIPDHRLRDDGPGRLAQRVVDFVTAGLEATLAPGQPASAR